MSDNSLGSFIQKNKFVILSTIGVSVTALSAYYYLNHIKSQSSTSSTSNESAGNGEATQTQTSKSKKKKNKKKSKAATPAISKKYPTNSEGIPTVTPEYVSQLSEAEVEEISNLIKEDGNEFFKKKEFNKAIDFYTSALAIKEDPIFYSNRSACYVGLDNFDKVVEDTTSALKLKPSYTKCLLRRANAHEQLGNYEDAMFDLTALSVYGGFNNKSVEGVLDRVLKKHSYKIVEANLLKNANSKQLPSAYSVSSFFGAFEKDTPESVGLSSESLTENTGDFYLFKALENFNLQSDEGYASADSYFEQASKAYEKELETISDEEQALELKKKLSLALEFIGIFQFLKLDPLASLETILKSLSTYERPRSYVFNALINADRREYEKSFKLLDTALEKSEGNSSEIYYHKAQLHYLNTELGPARENFLKAKELNPENVYAYIQLACIDYREGNSSKAEAAFKEAKLKFPTSPEVPNYYGEILGDKGDIPNALKQFDISAKLQQSFYPKVSVGVLPLINKATILLKEPSPENFRAASDLLSEAVNLDPKSDLAKMTFAQLKLQDRKSEDAIKLFEEASLLARDLDEKVQATSFAEASKIQLRIRNDPIIGPKMEEIAARYGVEA